MIDAFKAHTYPKINGWTGSRLKKQKRVASSQFVIISYRLSELECTSWLWTSGPTIRCGEQQLHRRYREIPPSNDPNDDGGAIERHLAFNAGSRRGLLSVTSADSSKRQPNLDHRLRSFFVSRLKIGGLTFDEEVCNVEDEDEISTEPLSLSTFF